MASVSALTPQYTLPDAITPDRPATRSATVTPGATLGARVPPSVDVNLTGRNLVNGAPAQALALAAPNPTRQSSAARVSPPTLKVSLRDEGGPQGEHAVLLWQGFQHDWLRRAAGFAVPHRISKFESRITNEQHTMTSDGLSSQADFVAGQNTGVDGDYMRPEGYWTRIYSPDLHVTRATATISNDDQLTGGRAPRAETRLRSVVRVPAPDGDNGSSVAVLQGIRFDSACLDGADSCNSDGIWPYEFSVNFGAVERSGDELVIPLEVTIGRAWTPRRGGIPIIEEKALSERMRLALEVDFAVVTAPQDSMTVDTRTLTSAYASNHAQPRAAQTTEMGMPSGTAETADAVGLSGFSFSLSPAGRSRGQQHRGRYVGGWQTRVRGQDSRSEGTQSGVEHQSIVSMPRTVARTAIEVSVTPALIQLGHPQATTTVDGEVSGDICSDSNGAPFFSKWQQCDNILGTQQLTDVMPISITP